MEKPREKGHGEGTIVIHCKSRQGCMKPWKVGGARFKLSVGKHVARIPEFEHHNALRRKEISELM